MTQHYILGIGHPISETDDPAAPATFRVDDDNVVLGLNGPSGELVELGAGGDNEPSLRFVAVGGAGIPCNINTGIFQCMSRSFHIATEDLTSIALEYCNAYVSGGGNASVDGLEKGLGTDMTLTASIEYPEGTFTRVQFDGANSVVIPNLTKVQSDFIAVNIPKGAEFYVRTFQVNAGGIIFRQGAPTNVGEGFRATGSTDMTLGGTVTQSTDTVFPPLAILGMTSKESYLLLGDSMIQGSADRLDQYKVTGMVSRGLRDKLLGYCNLGVRGDLLNGFVASSTIRKSMLIYATRVISDYGINDVLTGRTYAQIISDWATFWALVPQSLKYQIQLPPAQTTSTDYFATTGSQSLGAQAAKRAGLNFYLEQNKITGVRVIYTSFLETAQNSGIFKTSPVGRVIADASITTGTNTLSHPAATFTEKDDWSAVRIPGAGAAAGNLTCFMRYVSSSSATLVTSTGSTQNAGTTVASVSAYISAAQYTTDGLHYLDRAHRDLLNDGFMEIVFP